MNQATNNELMLNGHQSDARALWSLSARQALTLRIGPQPRELQVMCGRVWLTSTSQGARPSADVWLSVGEGVHLPAGCQVVIEAWPEARFELLVPPVIAQRRSGVPALHRGLCWLAVRVRSVAGVGRAGLRV